MNILLVYYDAQPPCTKAVSSESTSNFCPLLATSTKSNMGSLSPCDAIRLTVNVQAFGGGQIYCEAHSNASTRSIWENVQIQACKQILLWYIVHPTTVDETNNLDRNVVVLDL